MTMAQRVASLETTVTTLQAELASLRVELETLRGTPLQPARAAVVPPTSRSLGQLPHGAVGQTAPPSHVAPMGGAR